MSESRQPPTPRALLQRLESLRAAGVETLPRKTGRPLSPAPKPPEPAQATPPSRETAVRATPAPVTQPATAQAGVAPTLAVLRQQVAGCTACGELSSTRQQTVFGVGNPDARLCFLGEAPGADEDRLGEPFVGRAGQLLDKMIVACKLSRDEVYILNTLKCRPPGNRNPTPDESAACRPFLQRQLELIDPEFVCCLGAVAARNFLEVDSPIGRLRGKVHHHAGRKVVCTYHPAYLLRNPSAKRQAWDDLKLLMREMGFDL